MKLNWQQLDLHLAQAWIIARGRTDVAKVIVVELTDDDGVTGRGEAAPISRYKESLETVEAFLRRIDPNQLRSMPQATTYLESLSSDDMAAKCAIDIALSDIAAKRAGKPIYDFLGLGFKERQHVTSFSIGIATPVEIRNKVTAAEKYPVLKLKLGGPDDKEALRVLREVAPKKTIRVDANEAWRTKEEALTNIEWLATDSRIEFVEQPMPASTTPSDWKWLKQRSALPIFADESYHLAANAEHAAECFHGVNVKLVKTAGVSGGAEALKAARKAGLQTMIGCMIETSILISAAAHLAELCNYMDIDGNLLITDDPYQGVSAEKGILSFANAPEKTGLCVSARAAAISNGE